MTDTLNGFTAEPITLINHTYMINGRVKYDNGDMSCGSTTVNTSGNDEDGDERW